MHSINHTNEFGWTLVEANDQMIMLFIGWFNVVQPNNQITIRFQRWNFVVCQLGSYPSNRDKEYVWFGLQRSHLNDNLYLFDSPKLFICIYLINFQNCLLVFVFIWFKFFYLNLNLNVKGVFVPNSAMMYTCCSCQPKMCWFCFGTQKIICNDKLECDVRIVYDCDELIGSLGQAYRENCKRILCL